MYNLKRYNNKNSEPWITSYEIRLKKMKDFKRLGFKVAIFLYETPDSSTFRYRAYNICQTLELSTKWKGIFFYDSEIKEVINYIGECVDLIVAVRYKWNVELGQLIKVAHEKGIRVGFDVDDLIYDAKYVPDVMQTLAIENSDFYYNFWFAQSARYETTLNLADFTITTNEYLNRILKDDTGKPGYVIPNFMNRLQLSASEYYFEQKKTAQSDGHITIGYFSGSPSHYKDFLVATNALEYVLDKYSQTEVIVAGYMKMPEVLEKYAKEKRVRKIDFQNFVDLQKSIAEVDINIAPLVNNTFSNAKSELKFFEAAVTGVITLATPTYTFKHSIIDGETGYLCNNDEWVNKLDEVINTHIYKDNNFAARERKYVIERYAYFNQIKLIEEVFREVE